VLERNHPRGSTPGFAWRSMCRSAATIPGSGVLLGCFLRRELRQLRILGRRLFRLRRGHGYDFFLRRWRSRLLFLLLAAGASSRNAPSKVNLRRSVTVNVGSFSSIDSSSPAWINIRVIPSPESAERPAVSRSSVVRDRFSLTLFQRLDATTPRARVFEKPGRSMDATLVSSPTAASPARSSIFSPGPRVGAAPARQIAAEHVNRRPRANPLDDLLADVAALGEVQRPRHVASWGRCLSLKSTSKRAFPRGCGDPPEP